MIVSNQDKTISVPVGSRLADPLYIDKMFEHNLLDIFTYIFEEKSDFNTDSIYYCLRKVIDVGTKQNRLQIVQTIPLKYILNATSDSYQYFSFLNALTQHGR